MTPPSGGRPAVRRAWWRRSAVMVAAAVTTAVGIVSGGARSAQAQPVVAAESRLAVSAGVDWTGSANVGGEDATLTPNGGASPYVLFRTESTLAGGPGPAAAVAVRVTRGFWAEVAVRYHSATLATRVTGDVEAEDASVSEGVQQLQAQAGVLWLPDRLRLSRRLRLFATGGGGFLRQLHSTNTLGENGRSYYAGGGLIVELPERPNGTFKRAGVRLDVRATAIEDGIAFGRGLHTAPAVWAALFLRF